jgi:hypothetical protein
MSCLYSSPEVTSLGKLALDRRCHRFARPGTRASGAPNRKRTQFHTDLPYVAVNKDAFPNSPACVAGGIKSFRLPKQAQGSSVSFQAQYQAFVRFAVGSGAAL